MRNARLVISVLFPGWLALAGCASDTQKHQHILWSDKGTTAERRDDAIVGCIDAIHTRLVSLGQKFPQLSGIKEASVTARSLRYSKGNVWYDGKTEHWGSADACRIYVNFEKYSTAELHQQGAVVQFPKSGIQVHWLILPIRRDSMEFLSTVDLIIREEAKRLGETLE